MLEGREPEAAIVAARLKAFQANPALHGPRFAEGAEPLPEGGIVLRFAQGKVPASLAPSQVEARQLRGAAELFVRRVCLWERADHYQTLCAHPNASHETLKENYHLLMSLLHPDRQEGAESQWPESCAQRVNLAYATLGDAASRRQYDAVRRTERPRRQPATPRPADARVRDVRFAKVLLVVSSVIALLIAAGLLVHEDEWSDRSVLQASLARLRIDPVPGASRPRYVGASTVAHPPRASDATAGDDSPTLEILRPIMRAFSPVERKPEVVSTSAAVPASAVVPVPPSEPLVVARAQLPIAPAPILLPFAQAQAAPAPSAAGPTNADIENVVVALVTYYEAGDADRIVDLVDPQSMGFFRRTRLRQAYTDFFRDTRIRQLRIDRLVWNSAAGGANARGEATVRAEYSDRAPFEKRVEMALDIVVRDGKPRLARLELFPGTP